MLEQIVGPIQDEYDEKSEALPGSQASDQAKEVELDGATRIRDLETEYGIDIPADGGFETLAGFLMLYYSRESPPPEVLINLTLPDRDALMEALGKSLGRVPQLRVPQRGRGVKWIELAQENAHNALRMRRAQAELAAEGRQILERVLKLPAPPERVWR